MHKLIGVDGPLQARLLIDTLSKLLLLLNIGSIGHIHLLREVHTVILHAILVELTEPWDPVVGPELASNQILQVIRVIGVGEELILVVTLVHHQSIVVVVVADVAMAAQIWILNVV